MQYRATRALARVSVGFASGPDGRVLGYARLAWRGRERTFRLVPPTRSLSALQGRDAAYAAVQAAAVAVRRLGIRDVEFAVDDPDLPVDLRERRTLSASLVLPYVALRCQLNRFESATVLGPDAFVRDLTTRARAEAYLNAAA